MSGQMPEPENALTGIIHAYSPEDRERILEAFRLGRQKSINSPLGTAAVLAELKSDADSLAALFLRDYLGSAEAAETIKDRFGKEILCLAEETAKIAAVSGMGKTVQDADRIRRMFFALVTDIRAILIRLAEKLHTMRTADTLSQEERKAAAQECLDIYAPLADRLGISWIKDELEDISLKELNRDVYIQIKEIVALKRGERSAFLDTVRDRINTEAAAAGIAVDVQSRAKHFYSIYRKMRKRSKGPGELYDLFGLRLLCETIDHCYTLLGLVHRLWKPLDGRFKDYIAMPKPNGYRSLHTAVQTDSEETILEIQIRTREMHQTAEYGVAGHWLYKQGPGARISNAEVSIVDRLRSSAENNAAENSAASRQFLEQIKRELLKDSIYVFTPQGKVLELPAGSTPLDFAFHIHTSVGQHCQMAKAGGIIVPLNAELKNTQVVEIITAAAAHPTANWLRFVKTAKARAKIRSWLQEYDANFAKKEEIPKPKTELSAEVQNEEKPEERHQLVQQRGIFKVKVEDEKNMLFRFARCCNPILGDPITGYVSRGRGIIIHRESCKNLAHIPDFHERRIEAQWETTGVPVKRFRVEAKYRESLFSEIEGAVRKYQGHLIEGRLEETGTNRLTGYFTMQLENRDDAQKILRQIRGIPAVSSIQGM
ncbi:GTP pyrophosphokinase [Spirochaetia bacterium]|nr:GTP pyrophosphokinase [Spirochaetia bacterium]